jgi:cell division protein FtsI (penicillin-binding protein 3)
MAIKKDISWRFGVVYLVVLFLGLLFLVKIVTLQLFQANYYEEKASEQSLKNIIIESNRGDIYAANDRILASSVPYYEIRMDMRSTALSDELFLKEVDSLAHNLSRLFRDKNKEDYRAELVAAWRKGERYHLIKKGVSHQQLKQLKTFPLFRLGRYKGGFIYVQDNKRIKPHINLASRTIGYLTKGPSGNVVGIEGAYDHELRGVTGIKLMQRLSGNVWMPLNDKNEIDPRDGLDVVTTIDVNLQDVAEKALTKQLIRHNAHHGTVVLMEVKTGEVKAIVNLEIDEDGYYREFYNYAIGESTEPGSTFKLPVLMTALEQGVVDLNDTIDTGDGSFTLYDKTIVDTRNEGYGRITVKEVFEVSSNVGVSKIIHENFKDREHEFVDRLYSMSLNKKLGVEIKGEGRPEIKYPGDKYWSGISLAMISHGYEIRMTPLQILAFYNAVANDGKMIKPMFVKELRDHGEVVSRFETEVLNPSICSESTLRKAREMLEGVVERGTASNLRNQHYKIAGKTGTAQIAIENTGYKLESQVSYQASFVGYFPADDPMYSCIVVINSPSNSVYYGNLVAGPVFKEISDKVFATSLHMHASYNGSEERYPLDPPYSKNGHKDELASTLDHLGFGMMLAAQGEWVITTRRDSFIEMNSLPIHEKLVPNVVEMGLKDAVYLCERVGLKVRVIGRGKVKEQSILPGSLVNRGSSITLTMSFI